MDELIGHKILKVEIGSGENYLRFSTPEKEYIYITDADCCSETWFSEIMNLNFLINHTVSEVEQLNLPQDFNDGNCRQESDSFYGYKIATEAGHCTIVFRNSSNGYYGGSVVLFGEYHGTLSLTINWQDISNLSDWTAYEVKQGSFFQHLKLSAFW